MGDRGLLAAGAAIGAGGTLLAALAPSVPVTVAGIAVAGIGTSVCAPTLLGLAGRLVGPDQRGSAVSAVTTLAYAGFLVGPAAHLTFRRASGVQTRRSGHCRVRGSGQAWTP